MLRSKISNNLEIKFAVSFVPLRLRRKQKEDVREVGESKAGIK